MGLPDGAFEFSGYSTTASNGGFTNSYGYFADAVDLSACTSIAFEAKGDMHRYKLSLMSGQMNMWGGSSRVQADFYPPETWTEIAIPLEEMEEPRSNWRGMTMPAFNAAETGCIGVSHSAFLTACRKTRTSSVGISAFNFVTSAA